MANKSGAKGDRSIEGRREAIAGNLAPYGQSSDLQVGHHTPTRSSPVEELCNLARRKAIESVGITVVSRVAPAYIDSILQFEQLSGNGAVRRAISNFAQKEISSGSCCRTRGSNGCGLD
jgi:hypothetical protein